MAKIANMPELGQLDDPEKSPEESPTQKMVNDTLKQLGIDLSKMPPEYRKMFEDATKDAEKAYNDLLKKNSNPSMSDIANLSKSLFNKSLQDAGLPVSKPLESFTDDEMEEAIELVYDAIDSLIVEDGLDLSGLTAENVYSRAQRNCYLV